jgi:hypothetical protein
LLNYLLKCLSLIPLKFPRFEKLFSSPCACSLSLLILKYACGTPFSTTLGRGEAGLFALFDSGFPSCYALVSRWALIAREPQDLEGDSRDENSMRSVFRKGGGRFVCCNVSTEVFDIGFNLAKLRGMIEKIEKGI